MQKNVFLKSFISAVILLFSFGVNAANEYRLIIDIPSYNNKDWCIKNLQSVLNQMGHTNYIAVITDDCSPDGTGDILEKFIKELSQEQREHVMLIKNKQRRGALANHYNVIQLAGYDDVIIHLDGDDFFKTTDVFTFLNDLYKNQSIWWTYGMYENWPDSTMQSFSRRLTEEDGITRATVPFVFGPVRSYRGWFAKRIKLEDLIADFEPCLGKFYASAGDFALMYPLREMSSGEHLYYIDRILYTRNVATPINDFKVNKSIQEKCARTIKESSRYGTLAPSLIKEIFNNTASVIVFDVQKDVNQLEQCLLSLNTYAINYKKINVFYNGGAGCSSEYEAFIRAHSEVNWFNFDALPKGKDILWPFRRAYAPFLLLMSSSDMVARPIDLKEACQLLNSTKAYTLALGIQTVPVVPHEWLTETLDVWNKGVVPGQIKEHVCNDGIYLWRLGLAKDKIKDHLYHGSLYKFGAIMDVAIQVQQCSVEAFLNLWNQTKANPRHVGLYTVPACIDQQTI